MTAACHNDEPPAGAALPCRAAAPARIAFCITHLGLGGAEKALCNLVLGLDRRRWQPAVFHLSGPDRLAQVLRDGGVPVTLVPARHRWDLTVVPRLAWALRRWRPQLLQTFLFHANIAGRLAGCCAGVKCIVAGARVAERRSRVPLIVDNLTCRLASHTVCVSRGVARLTHEQAHWPWTRLSVIPNAVEVERFAAAAPAELSRFGIPDSSFVFLFVGRLEPQKGPQYLLEALADAGESLGSAHLLLVGQGPLRERLEEQAAALGCSGRVHFAGWRPDVAALLHAADALVLPSLWEGMPNVVLEAMSAGRAVIGTCVEGTGELIQHGKTGLLVPPADPPALAGAMVQVAQSSSLRRRLAGAAKRRVAREFTPGAMVAAYEALYERLLSGERPGATR